MECPSLDRRDMLQVSLLGAAAVALPLQGALTAKSASRLSSSKLPRPYTLPLTTPPVLGTTYTDATTGYYVVRQQAIVGTILPGFKRPSFAYNGTVPGPTPPTYDTPPEDFES